MLYVYLSRSALDLTLEVMSTHLEAKPLASRDVLTDACAENGAYEHLTRILASGVRHHAVLRIVLSSSFACRLFFRRCSDLRYKHALLLVVAMRLCMLCCALSLPSVLAARSRRLKTVRSCALCVLFLSHRCRRRAPILRSTVRAGYCLCQLPGPLRRLVRPPRALCPSEVRHSRTAIALPLTVCSLSVSWPSPAPLAGSSRMAEAMPFSTR